MLEYMRAGGGIIWIITLLSFVALAVISAKDRKSVV